jgi:hypothetical protein
MKKIIVNDNNQLRQLIDDQIALHGPNCDLNHIDVSQINDMRYMFYNSNFNGDISQWDVSKVEDMSSIFQGSQFNGDISNWNVSRVKNMGAMFNESHFNNDISRWDVSNVKSMWSMFRKSLFNGNISNWNISNVKEMYYMFNESQFNGDISNWKPYKAEIDNIFLNTHISIPYWASYEDIQEREGAINNYIEKKELNNSLTIDLKTKSSNNIKVKI